LNKGSPMFIAVATPYQTFSANSRGFRIISILLAISYICGELVCFSPAGKNWKQHKKMRGF
jgi:hypothetical protein